MKKFIISSVILLCSIAGFAQDRHNFEIGLGTGYPNLANPKTIVDRQVGGSAYLEYRYEIADQFFLGARLDYKISGGSYESANQWKAATFHQNDIQLVMEYDFDTAGAVVPFISLGLGPGGGHYKAKESEYAMRVVYGVGNPRVGIEISDHFRIALDGYLAIGRLSENSVGMVPPFNSVGIDLGWKF